MGDDVESAASGDEASLRLGSHIKLQRRKRGWTLEQLSSLCGVSIAAISKIEKGQSSPSFDTVLRIARALQINFVEMMEGPHESRSVSARLISTKLGETEEYDTTNYRYHVHSTGLMRKVMIPLQMTVLSQTPPPVDEWSTHDGEEFLFVLDGAVSLLTEQYAPVTLKKGESCYFDSTMRHTVVSAIEGASEIISICLSIQPFEDAFRR